jgi:hypothetical protein
MGGMPNATAGHATPDVEVEVHGLCGKAPGISDAARWYVGKRRGWSTIPTRALDGLTDEPVRAIEL